MRKSCSGCLAATHLENDFRVSTGFVPSRPRLLEGVDGWARDCVFIPLKADTWLNALPMIVLFMLWLTLV